jgi:GT2 family glycosyltransferase
MSDQPMVFAVILAWNQLKETLECLGSLLPSSYPNMRIVVVDNGSTDGTSDALAREFPNVKRLRTDVNIGLERGYNMGFEYALKNDADYILAMNNDTIVDIRMVENLIQGIQNHPKAGIVSPKIYHYFGDRSRLWCAGARWAAFPPRIKLIGANAADSPKYQKDFTLPYVTSCCILISREALQKTGLLDPSYFFYYNDWDMSARFWAAGYEIWFIANAHLWHKVSMSTQKAEKPDRWWYVMGRSGVRFYLQYKSAWMLMVYSTYFVIREIFKLKFKRIFPYLFGVAEGLADHWGWRQ